MLLWVLWVQFIFGQFLVLAYISQDLQALSCVVGTNYRILTYCTCHFQGGSLCFSFFCLLVSSVSDFSPDTRRAVVDTFFQAHLFSRAVGREGCCKQITLVCAHSVSATLGLTPLKTHVPSLPTLLRLQVAPQGTVRASPGLHAPPRSKLFRFRYSGKSSEAQTWLGLRFVPFLGPRRSCDQVLASSVAVTYCLPHPCCLVFWVYNRHTFSGEG